MTQLPLCKAEFSLTSTCLAAGIRKAKRPCVRPGPSRELFWRSRQTGWSWVGPRLQAGACRLPWEMRRPKQVSGVVPLPLCRELGVGSVFISVIRPLNFAFETAVCRISCEPCCQLCLNPVLSDLIWAVLRAACSFLWPAWGGWLSCFGDELIGSS